MNLIFISKFLKKSTILINLFFNKIFKIRKVGKLKKMETLYFFFLVIFAITFANAQIMITNCTELQMMQTGNASSPLNYILASDIDCSSIVNFIPIGNSSFPFYGEINGQGYSIYNLKINTSGNAGLIGYSENCNLLS